MALVEAPEGMSARRWEVLASLAKTLAESGYYAVGMRTLAQDAGLNPGTLYHHFASKDDALLSICMAAHERTLRDLRQVMAQQTSFTARVKALFDAHCASLDEMGDFLQVYINLREHVPAHMAAPLEAGWLAYRRLLGRLFNDAKQAGEIRSDLNSKHLSRMLVALIRVVNQLHRAGRAREIALFAELAHETFVRGLRSSW
jgi:AcrR family transcriptional regulator